MNASRRLNEGVAPLSQITEERCLNQRSSDTEAHSTFNLRLLRYRSIVW